MSPKQIKLFWLRIWWDRNEMIAFTCPVIFSFCTCLYSWLMNSYYFLSILTLLPLWLVFVFLFLCHPYPDLSTGRLPLGWTSPYSPCTAWSHMAKLSRNLVFTLRPSAQLLLKYVAHWETSTKEISIPTFQDCWSFTSNLIMVQFL